MNDSWEAQLFLAAQSACPFPLDSHRPLPAGVERLEGEYVLRDTATRALAPGTMLTNLRLIHRDRDEWEIVRLREVRSIDWRSSWLGRGQITLTFASGATFEFAAPGDTAAAAALIQRVAAASHINAPLRARTARFALDQAGGGLGQAEYREPGEPA